MLKTFDLAALDAREGAAMRSLGHEIRTTGFLRLANTGISAAQVQTLIATYRAFFRLPAKVKADIDMARTGANRGWGAGGAEQVDPNANPDYKQVFDCGYTLPAEHPLSALPVYAPNLWPETPAEFREVVADYYAQAMTVAMRLLRAIASAIGADEGYFDAAFDPPMALLRGNYYPERPDWAGARDFGIAEHTDYGCLTLLAMDGVPGLEVRDRDGEWVAANATPGEFIINFGEMLEIWTGGNVRATPHRVVGSAQERISVPLFFNPSHDTVVSPEGAPRLLAGEHLARRFGETYLHLKNR